VIRAATAAATSSLVVKILVSKAEVKGMWE
jgi:hypothetical protein